MKIYDCFMFFNELDLLEVRFEEMWDLVDYFIISESNISHSGNPKSYMLLDNWERFKKYHSKIRHIKVEDFPNNATGMMRDNWQRMSVQNGLYDVEPDDLIIISDLDEIPRAELVEMIKHDTNDYDRYILCIPQFRHRINYMKVHETHKYPNIMITRARVWTNPQQEREFTFYWNPKPRNSVILEHGGWHFTYIGDDEKVKFKIKNYAHTELNLPSTVNNLNLEELIKKKISFQPGPCPDEKFEYVLLNAAIFLNFQLLI